MLPAVMLIQRHKFCSHQTHCVSTGIHTNTTHVHRSPPTHTFVVQALLQLSALTVVTSAMLLIIFLIIKSVQSNIKGPCVVEMRHPLPSQIQLFCPILRIPPLNIAQKIIKMFLKARLHPSTINRGLHTPHPINLPPCSLVPRLFLFPSFSSTLLLISFLSAILSTPSSPETDE